MHKVALSEVFFKLEIEDVFPIKGRPVAVVTGRAACGEIHYKAAIIITDESGIVLVETVVLDLDWFDRRRCGEHVTAEAGMNVAVIFDIKDELLLKVGHYIVII